MADSSLHAEMSCSFGLCTPGVKPPLSVGTDAVIAAVINVSAPLTLRRPARGSLGVFSLGR